MNPLGQVPTVKFIRDSGEPSMAIPRPMEGLHGICPPPFLTKTYNLVDDPNTNHIVAWSKGNNSFIVWDPETFSIQLLPKYFKHSNLSSFIRQLNTYGIRKVDPERLEFANEWFLRGQRHLLKNIKRRKTPSRPQSSHQDFGSCVEVGESGPNSEIDRLRRDKQVLMVELVKLRQEQQNTKAHLKAMEHKLKGTEMKQQEAMGFLARIIQNPSFVQQFDRRKEHVEAISNKGENHVKLEPQDYGDVAGFKERDVGHKLLDKGFWEDLLNGGIEEDMGF